MVDEDRLREWVEEKLDEGVEEERLKKSLRETGHDPSIVDEVRSPFEDSKDVSEDVFQEDDADKSGSQSEKEEEQGSESYEGFEEDDTGSENRLPDFSLPSMSLPSIDLSEISRQRILPVLLVFLLFAGVAGYALLPGFMESGGIEAPSGDSISGLLEGKESSEKGCPDVGVRIEKVSVVDGETVADVLVTRGEAEVVLKVFRDGDLMDSETARIGGEGTITVSSTGDEVLFHPSGCERFRDTEKLS